MSVSLSLSHTHTHTHTNPTPPPPADLLLGGCWKDGYPGIVVVEGDSVCVTEYVRRIQRLHWKHMVVRGEIQDCLTASTKTATNNTYTPQDSSAEGVKTALTAVDLDAERMFPLPVQFVKFPDMSELAAHCKLAGLEKLFLTSMKKYN